jgi:hypothetical protein
VWLTVNETPNWLVVIGTSQDTLPAHAVLVTLLENDGVEKHPACPGNQARPAIAGVDWLLALTSEASAITPAIPKVPSPSLGENRLNMFGLLRARHACGGA